MGHYFDTEIIRSQDATVLAVIGELDLATAPWLEGQLALALASSPGRVILELDRVTFIDAHGLRLLEHHTQSAEHGERVRIERPSFPVRRMFALTGMCAI